MGYTSIVLTDEANTVSIQVSDVSSGCLLGGVQVHILSDRDLAMRNLVRVEESPGPGADETWRVGCLVPATSRHETSSLLGYERRLLNAMSDPAGDWSLAALPPDLPSVLVKVRSALVGEAVHQGWLRRLRHGKRTAEGDALARHIRSFHRSLKGLKTGQGEGALTGRLLPYALRFGLLSRDLIPPARFAQAWVEACARLPGWRAERKRRQFDDEALFKPYIDTMSSGYLGDPGLGYGHHPGSPGWQRHTGHSRRSSPIPARQSTTRHGVPPQRNGTPADQP